MLEVNYEQGLKNLQLIVQRQSPELLEKFGVLQARLIEAIGRGRMFGAHSANNAEQSEVLYALLHFSREHFALNFIELCQTNDQSVSSAVQTETQASAEVRYVPLNTEWHDEVEITVQGNRYILHEPVEKIWSNDHSALRIQAKAQQIGTNRMVWIKHTQIYRVTSAAMAWKTALEKEQRLLDMLESEQRANFPRCLTFETTLHSATLIHIAAHGSSWRQFITADGKPSEVHLTHMLLRSIPPLCEMLKVLHAKHLAHRMLMPEHILLMQNRNSIVQDVGLATYPYTPGEGPKLYRAPEQAIANQTRTRPGPPTDIYQLGMILYQLISGNIPITAGTIIPPSTWNEGCSPALDTTILKAIKPRPEERWPSIQVFNAALKKTLL